ncbi:MAG: helix-turn-helix transcriptional regulator, partial [Alphaproteobacteria bacterium]|nr:helix-turn-helix transcriptional regulator [Alphaproteobacteria bacterium]
MQQNITMSDFAKQTGITVSVYHRIESGEREIYKTEFVAIAKTLKLEPEELTKEIYNLYKGGVLDKYSENLRAGRGKAHVSADAKSIMNLSKTLYGKEIYEFSKNKMVALLGEGREDGKLHVDKTAEALVFAPFSLRRRKKVYAVKSHPKSTKNILPEHAIYFIRYDSKVSEGDLAVVYEKDFDQHEKHDAEIVSVEKRGEDLWAVSHASGNEFKIKSLQKNQIHRVVFIALDDEDQA